MRDEPYTLDETKEVLRYNDETLKREYNAVFEDILTVYRPANDLLIYLDIRENPINPTNEFKEELREYVEQLQEIARDRLNEADVDD